uniref:Seminal fluid protein HACP057 n=1 Tax=Heliconius melpomene TaxID=34740 RepID=D9HQA0_HELME|nr:seminal fluid protein HACP057 [Heliconius melpomene]
MKIFSCIVLLVAVAVVSGDNKPHYDDKDAPELFEKFVKEHNRHYKDEADRKEHYEAFVNSLHQINEANAKSDHATFDITQFSDYTPEELKKTRGLTPH